MYTISHVLRRSLALEYIVLKLADYLDLSF